MILVLVELIIFEQLKYFKKYIDNNCLVLNQIK